MESTSLLKHSLLISKCLFTNICDKKCDTQSQLLRVDPFATKTVCGVFIQIFSSQLKAKGHWNSWLSPKPLY